MNYELLLNQFEGLRDKKLMKNVTVNQTYPVSYVWLDHYDQHSFSEINVSLEGSAPVDENSIRKVLLRLAIRFLLT